MANRAPNSGRSQALVASSPTQFLIPQPAQPLAAGIDGLPSTTADNRAARLAFLTAGTLLALASIAIAALNGWSRGASLPESLVWAAAGIALALVSLFGLSLMLTHQGQRRAAAGIAWLLGLTFTVIAALGSQHGGRELAGRVDGAAIGDRARYEADYKRGVDDLALLPATRPAAVIGQELVTILQDQRLRDCRGWLASWRLRKVCTDRVEPVRAELANAQARERLQATMATASAALGTATVGKPANADASAVQRYLSAVGIHVGTERLADILNLLTVFAVEFCGAAALALGRRPAASVGYNTCQQNTGDGGLNAGVNAPVNTPPGGVQAPVAPALNAPVNAIADAKTAATIERLKRRILGDLERGPRSCSQRSLATEFGASLGYLNKALHELAEVGAVNVNTSRVGTTVELVNP
jgi:hypothetical protein